MAPWLRPPDRSARVDDAALAPSRHGGFSCPVILVRPFACVRNCGGNGLAAPTDWEPICLTAKQPSIPPNGAGAGRARGGGLTGPTSPHPLGECTSTRRAP